MSSVIIAPGIKGIDFIGDSMLMVHLDNDRTFMVPLTKFSSLQRLTKEERKQFEIIDDHYLSFLALDEIYSVSELLGFQN